MLTLRAPRRALLQAQESAAPRAHIISTGTRALMNKFSPGNKIGAFSFCRKSDFRGAEAFHAAEKAFFPR